MKDLKHFSRRATDRRPNHIIRRDKLLGLIACGLLTVIGTMSYLIILTNNLPD